uniref:Uncharacterized protein n=1 Tax=Anguilla anguilla TaxID=7936 RepID=A0A0E9U356_ANGAN
MKLLAVHFRKLKHFTHNVNVIQNTCDTFQL